MADGPSIRQYIRDTAQQFGIEQKIRFGLKTTSASWCSSARLWTVTALHEESGETRQFTARFVVMCTGYYNYDAGFLPQFAGVEQLQGHMRPPAAVARGAGLHAARRWSSSAAAPLP